MQRKQVLYVLAVLAMLVSMLPAAALAQEAPPVGQGISIEEFAAPDYKSEGRPEGLQTVPFAPDGMSFFNETEPNDTAATANALPGSQVVVLANISPATEVDYFSFTANAGDRVYAATMTQFSNGGSTDTIVDVIASDGTTVLESDDDNGSFSATSSAIGGTTIPADGTYYIKVDGFSTSALITPYHLHVRVQSGAPTAEVEPNNDLGTATPLAASQWMTGTMLAIADPDLFSFSLSAGDSVYIGLDMDPGRLPSNTLWSGRLGFGTFNNFFLVANDAGTTKPSAEAFFMTVQEAGTYYAYVDSAVATGLGATARYHLSVSIYPKQVQSNCTTITSADVPKVIGPAAGTTTSTIVVPPTVTSSISDINATIVLTHTNMADLDVTLVGPTAANTVLFTDVGASSQVTMDIGMDDQAALPIGTFTVVKDIVYMPEQPGRLATFNGLPAGGTWTLQIADDTTNTGGGRLQSWSLEVCGDPPPAYGVELNKTVGLDPTTCAATDSITVPPGGYEVFYCYTARNTGLNTLTSHDLVDSELGQLLDDYPYSLAPGATTFVTQSAMIDVTTVNTGTWTASSGANSASDSDTATVNVPQYCPAGYNDVTLNATFFDNPFPPAGWTVTNTSIGCVAPGLPNWTNTNPGNRANLTGGVGPFAIADSDRCGSASTLDTIMTTGMLDFTGLISPTVSFNTDYDDIAVGGTNDRALLDVSVDGGGIWSNLFTWDGDHRGPLLVTQALPGAAGENDVQVRWHYAGGTYDWWWQVDNAFITACEPIPAISLDKTVGTDPNACATTDEITLPAGGGDVTYCYEVTNTGAVTLERHDLVDSELGALLSNFPYSLAPSASAFLTATTTIAATTVNTATWTAYNPTDGFVSASASDTATVTVEAAPSAPAIELNKTVGTVPGVCADTQKVTVPYGTSVYYCYQIENTGNVTMTVHSLVDDQLGALANNLAYVLPPGGFSPEVIVPDTAVITVTNTATWTAASSVGYVVDTNAAYNYIPINTTGTALALTDDGEANITIPWGATFFGVTSSDLRVANNGAILFNATTGDVSTANAALPNAALGLAIAPFWDDIDADTGDVYWEVQGTAPNRMLIVEWYNRPHFSNIGSATFEAILYEGTNEIKFQYADVDFGDVTLNNGASATVGINKNATTALQVSFNQPVIQNGQAILFTPATILTATDSDFAEVNVQIPNIDVDPLSMSSTQPVGSTTNQTLNIGNTGTAPLTWEIAETEPDRPASAGVQAASEPVFDVPAAVTSAKDCAAFENYPGTEPDGWAQFCGQPGDAPASSPSDPTSTGYVVNLRTPDRNLKQFTLNNFPGQTVVGAQAANIYGMDFDSTASTLYALNSSTNELGTLSTTTGAFTSIVACPAPAGGTWTGLSIDPTTDVFYASTAANLYTLNPATCSPTLIGPFGITGGIMIDLAVNPAGAMYGHDIFTDSIYTINTSTGAATLVGLTGLLANFAQGMDFDNEDGTLYIFLYVGAGVNHYGTVNLATGAVTALATTNPSGEFEGATQTLGLCIPNDYSWLSTAPISGTTAANSVTPVTVTFDATSLSTGTYTGQLCVRSNDPDNGPGNGTSLVQVPVTLTVETQLAPAIVLTKTVGLDPNACATTDEITVAPNTDVTYCYEVENTGNVEFNVHDLTDSELGALLNNFPYTLSPGASVFLTATTNIAVTTVNTAIWYAESIPPKEGFPSAQATDVATVTVAALNPAIVLNKTVGTVPGVCAVTQKVTVPAGTEVYYCYQVENTGDVEFNFHDLEDSELGTLLDNFPYTLAPGAFSPQVIVPETINITTTNWATWTAFTSLSGYIYDDGAPYDYVSIATFGTPLGLTDDSEANATIPFPFTFFGVTSSDVRIGNNGGILFNATTGDMPITNAALPIAAPALSILPFWDDIDADTGDVYYATIGSAPNRQFIVEWFNRPHFSNVGSATFQVVLYETTNQIKYLYADVNFGNASYDFGASATVGINKDGTTALQYSFNQPVITDQSAILWTPVEAVSATSSDYAEVNVQFPQIDVDPLSFDVKVGLGQTTTRTLDIANVGDAPLEWLIEEEDTTAATTPTVPNANPADALDTVQPGDGTKLADSAPAPLSAWRTPEAVLWDNGPLVTNPGGGAGGANASALQSALGLNIYGFGHAVSSGFRVADDFTVPAGGWLVSDITFFAYQTGSTTTSTINNVNLRIWDGVPGAGGSNVVFGDTTTNRLASSAWSNTYRVLDTGLLDTARPVMADVATVNTFLPAGTYWVDWQTGGTLASGPWAPPVSILGQTAKPGSNGLQYDPTAGTWNPLLDTGTALAVQDLPFIVQGAAAGATDCLVPSDIAWLTVTPDNGVTAAGGSTPVLLDFDATALAAGIYTGNLCISSNDPDAGPGNGTELVIVPITLEVNPPTAVVLTNLAAGVEQMPAPQGGLPLATLPATAAAAAAALGAAFVWRRKRD